MIKYILPLLLLVGCQAEPETPEPVVNEFFQMDMDLPDGFPSNEQESQALIDMVRTSTPNNRWWNAGDSQWSMYTQRLHYRGQVDE
tara:strand:- start:355 stop:612 length:258 start_codon:yes stop_codon:yes gene_type:complete